MSRSDGTCAGSSSYSALSLKSFPFTFSIDLWSDSKPFPLDGPERTFQHPFLFIDLLTKSVAFQFSIAFFFLSLFFFEQIRSWIVKNGRYRERCRTCVWALSVPWRRVNRRWSTVTSPAPTCRKSRQKAADSKRRSPSTASRISSSSAMKADPPNSK